MGTYLELSPLFENHWTGIPAVAAGLVEHALQDDSIDWIFLYENIALERSVVEDLLRLRHGGQFLRHLEQRLWEGKTIAAGEARRSTCIFTNVKGTGCRFGRTALIVHDFSTLLTPQFHNQDTIRHHATRILSDVETTDFFFCNSQATKGDLQAYFKVSDAAVDVLPMGVRIDPALLTEALMIRATTRIEPYICVLGTIEPRKNGAIVLQMLKESPTIAQRYKVVFVGRDGWRDEKRRLLGELSEQGIDPGRIVFTDFVGEERKLKLLLCSSLCIYPSFFEGYGIPIAEAAVLGKFIVCSNTSSMPEVAPEMCYFFDPLDVSSLAEAFSTAERAAQVSRLHTLGFSEIWPRIEARSWARAYAMVRGWAAGGNGA